MSMRCQMTVISAEAWEEIHRQFNSPEGQAELLERWTPPERARPGITRRLLSVFWSPNDSNEELAPDADYYDEQCQAIIDRHGGGENFDEIGEMWHLMHFFLSGEFDECDAVLGFLNEPTEVIVKTRDEPRLLSPDKVREINEALIDYSMDDLVSNWKEKGERGSREIYHGDDLTSTSPDDPNVWRKWDSILNSLKGLFARAAGQGAAIIIDIK